MLLIRCRCRDYLVVSQGNPSSSHGKPVFLDQETNHRTNHCDEIVLLTVSRPAESTFQDFFLKVYNHALQCGFPVISNATDEPVKPGLQPLEYDSCIWVCTEPLVVTRPRIIKELVKLPRGLIDTHAILLSCGCLFQVCLILVYLFSSRCQAEIEKFLGKH